jgi:hypothetical protein
MHQSGLSAWTSIRLHLVNFVLTMLFSTSREAIPAEKRHRMIAFAIGFPYALQADLLETRQLGRLHFSWPTGFKPIALRGKT